MTLTMTMTMTMTLPLPLPVSVSASVSMCQCLCIVRVFVCVHQLSYVCQFSIVLLRFCMSFSFDLGCSLILCGLVRIFCFEVTCLTCTPEIQILSYLPAVASATFVSRNCSK